MDDDVENPSILTDYPAGDQTLMDVIFDLFNRMLAIDVGTEPRSGNSSSLLMMEKDAYDGNDRLGPNEWARLRRSDADAGNGLGTFIHDAMLYEASRPGLMEILAPIHDVTEKSGATADEIDEMADRVLAEVCGKRH